MKKALLASLLGAALSTSCAQNVNAQATWNSSFEQGWNDWQKPVITSPENAVMGDAVEISKQHVKDGKQSLQLISNNDKTQILVKSQPQPLLENAKFQMVYLWFLYEGGRSRKFGAQVQLYDADHNPIPNTLVANDGSYLPVGEWFPIGLQIKPPENARFYTVEFYWKSGDGKVTFDDITIKPIVAQQAVQTGYALPAVSSPAHDVWVANQIEKIYPDAAVPKTTGSQIEMSAARGESQSIQLVYKPKAAQTTLTAWADDLKETKTGKTLPGKTIDVRYVTNVEVKWGIAQFGRGGPTPDPLLPTGPETVNANAPQSIWLTAEVPRDATPGIYKTQVQIQTSEGQIAVPLQLEVFDFALPETSSLKTMAITQHTNPIARKALRKRLVANRMTSEISWGGGVQNLAISANPDGTVKIDWAAWDAIMEEFFADGMQYFVVPNILFGGIAGFDRADKRWPYITNIPLVYGTLEWDKAVASYCAQMHEHLKQKGWLEYSIWNIWDEPMGLPLRDVVRHIATVVRQSAPEAKIMVTGWPVEKLDENIDIWSPQQGLYDAKLHQISGRESWVYNNGLYLIDLPYGLTNMRNQAWWMWNNNITGKLWWGTAYGWNNDLYGNLLQNSNQNGQGFLFYHGPNKDVNQVVDSMRIAAYRAAVNDYDYFTLVANAQDTAVKRLGNKAAVPSGRETVKTLIAAGEGKNNPNTLQEIRNLTARLITLLRQNPDVVLKLAPDYWQTKELAGQAKPGAMLRLGNQDFSADARGEFKLILNSATYR